MYFFLVFVFSEILVVGTGDKIVRLSPDVIKHMKEHNIMLEVQDTVSGIPLDLLPQKDWNCTSSTHLFQNILSEKYNI